jgi:hypothetical protein
MMTNTTHHVRNNQQWLQFMQASALPKNFFSAIILTGWSRFDHFMPLCDLLPSAYPALIYSLHALNTNQFLASDSIMNCDRLLRSIGKDSRACEAMPGKAQRADHRCADTARLSQVSIFGRALHRCRHSTLKCNIS